MNVVMLKPTRWNDGSLAEGDEVTVDLSVGQRWIRHGIAQAGEENQAQINPEDDNGANEGGEGGSSQEDNKGGTGNEGNEGGNADQYVGLKAKELYDMCKEKGIEVDPKKPEAYYIEKLTETDTNKGE